MAYRLEQGRPIADEVRRIAGRQLAAAVATMRAVGDPRSDEALHQARRRVKKVRTLVRLVRPGSKHARRLSTRRLREFDRLLAPIADAESTVATLDRLGEACHGDLPPHILDAARAGLLERWARVDRQVQQDRVVENGVALLQRMQERVPRWRVDGDGVAAVAAGLQRSVRRGRRAMRRVRDHPTDEGYHRWRRRVKDHWLEVRLLEGPCGDALAADERRLRALDGCLGEYHDCVLLQQALAGEVRLPREDTARLLRLIRRYRAGLRRQAMQLGGDVYREAPRRFVARVERAWRAEEVAA